MRRCTMRHVVPSPIVVRLPDKCGIRLGCGVGDGARSVRKEQELAATMPNPLPLTHTT